MHTNQACNVLEWRCNLALFIWHRGTSLCVVDTLHWSSVEHTIRTVTCLRWELWRCCSLLADAEQLIRTEGKLEKTKYTLAPSENLLQSKRLETYSWHLIIQSIHPSLRSPSQRTSIFGEVWGCGCLFKALTPDPEFSRVGVGEAAVCTAYLACQIRAGPRGRSVLIFSHACRILMSSPAPPLPPTLSLNTLIYFFSSCVFRCLSCFLLHSFFLIYFFSPLNCSDPCSSTWSTPFHI